MAIKQYIKDKPIKFGIKSFILCEGDTGYTVASKIYTGKSDLEVENLGVTGNVVVQLLKQGKATRKKSHLSNGRPLQFSATDKIVVSR